MEPTRRGGGGWDGGVEGEQAEAVSECASAAEKVQRQRTMLLDTDDVATTAAQAAACQPPEPARESRQSEDRTGFTATGHDFRRRTFQLASLASSLRSS